MIIAPSILSADFTNLKQELDSVKTAEWIHFDVMDGVFVPNISIGIPVLESVRKITGKTLDVHLMITNPERYAEVFCKAGADIVTIHIESAEPSQIAEALMIIRENGKRAGISVKPKTPVESVSPYFDLIDLLLIMTVEPGFGGQAFMEDQLTKITKARAEILRTGNNILIEVDGGINPVTARMCFEAGADALVAGSDIFKQKDRTARIAQLREGAGSNI